MSDKGKSAAGSTKSTITAAQGDYKGNSMHDLVEVTINKNTSFYKKGDVDNVHPATAAVFKELGIIDSYKGEPEKEEEKAAD